MTLWTPRQLALQATDSLHLAAAAPADARGLVTYDRHLRDAGLAMGSFEVFHGGAAEFA
jgi:hypothetical protein